jgi:regulator of PEP synthase PpsR (kinase-PPPase family)
MNLPKPVFVLSDGTGETAEKLVRAALQQFAGHFVHVQVHSNIESEADLETWFQLAKRQKAIVVSTLVQGEIRDAATRLATEYKVVHRDLIGGLLGDFATYLDMTPVGVPGLLHQADASYFRRIEAVEYTLKCDDGKEPRMLRHAEIVLVGVSRTSKTPLSSYLAHKGFKVGNVPIVLDHPLPDQVDMVDPTRVFALTIDPDTLRSIRRSRLRSMRMGKPMNYDDIDYILAELEYAEDLFRSQPMWPVIDVTNKAVEETAAVILRVLNDRGLISPSGDAL